MRPRAYGWLIKNGFKNSWSLCTQALINRPPVPHTNSWEPCYFAKFPDDPQAYAPDVLWLQEIEPRYTCLSKAKVSHSQIMWAEVSSCAPQLIHSGLFSSPSRWRYLLRVLCPVRRPVRALDSVLLKDRNLALAPRQFPEISSWVCLWDLPRSRHRTQYWLTNQRLILLHISCLETHRPGSGPRNLRTEPPLASSLEIKLPCIPEHPVTQYTPTECWVEISFNAFWYCWVNGDILMAWRAFKFAWPSEQICICLVYSEIELH
jgi:hypothetical protein